MDADPLQFIHYREQLIARLREVIPVLSQQLHSATNRRGERRDMLKPEAARILKNLSVELREAGLCCIESIARWMLTQQRMLSAPVYLWQGQEYILKMYTDLDFVVEVLGSYAARVGCFSTQNPLLLTKADLTGVGSRPDLARTYGALLILFDVVARNRRNAAAASPQVTTNSTQTDKLLSRTPPDAVHPSHQNDNGLTNGGTAETVPPPRAPVVQDELERITENSVGEEGSQTAEREQQVVEELELVQATDQDVNGHGNALADHRSESVDGGASALRGREDVQTNVNAITDAADKEVEPSEQFEESQNYDEDEFDAEQSMDASISQSQQQVEAKTEGSTKYEMVRELGHGAFARVWECDVQNFGRVAVKFLQQHEDDDEETVEYTKRSWDQELRLLKEFQHPNIIHFVVAVSHPEYGVGFGCEIAECNLLAVIDTWTAQHATKYSILAFQVLQQIGSAIEYLHNKQLLHRDIKPENVLVKTMQPINQYLAAESTVPGDFPALLLCDFGTTRPADHSPMARIEAKSTYVGSRWYRAPELLFQGESYTEAVDMWALGAMAVELMLGFAPFQGAQELDVMRSMMHRLGTPPGSAMQCLKGPNWSNGTVATQGNNGKLRDLVCTAPAGKTLWWLLQELLAFDFRDRLTASSLVSKVHKIHVADLATELPHPEVDDILRNITSGKVPVGLELLPNNMLPEAFRKVVDSLNSRLAGVLTAVGEIVAANLEGASVTKAKMLLESKVALEADQALQIRRLLDAGHQMLQQAKPAPDLADITTGCLVSSIVCSLHGLLLHDTSSTALSTFQSMLQICGLPSQLEVYGRILSPPAKSVLLQLMHKSVGFSKSPAVLDRKDVLSGLQSALRHIYATSQERATQPFAQIYPYFKSEHSRKVVDGVRVEEGEGLGPMKEMYQLCGQNLHRVWKPIGTAAVTASEGFAQLSITTTFSVLCVGMRIELENVLPGGSTWSVVIMSLLDDGKVRVERAAPADFENVEAVIYQREQNAFELLPSGDAVLNPRFIDENPRDADKLRDAGVVMGLALLNRMSLGITVDVTTLERILSSERSPEESCSWSEQQCCEGFFSIVNGQSFESLSFRSDDVRVLLGGSKPSLGFNFFDTFFVNYDQEVAQCAPLQESVRKCLESLGDKEKRAVLKFITGAEHAPPPKTEHLYISTAFFAYTDAERRALVHWLPNSHTCDNILQIPNYWEGLLATANLRESELTDQQADDLRKQLDTLLREKLLQAATMCGTYGLDGLSTESPRRSAQSPERVIHTTSQPRPQLQPPANHTRHFELPLFEQDMPEAESVVLSSPEVSPTNATRNGVGNWSSASQPATASAAAAEDRQSDDPPCAVAPSNASEDAQEDVADIEDDGVYDEEDFEFDDEPDEEFLEE